MAFLPEQTQPHPGTQHCGLHRRIVPRAYGVAKPNPGSKAPTHPSDQSRRRTSPPSARCRPRAQGACLRGEKSTTCTGTGSGTQELNAKHGHRDGPAAQRLAGPRGAAGRTTPRPCICMASNTWDAAGAQRAIGLNTARSANAQRLSDALGAIGQQPVLCQLLRASRRAAVQARWPDWRTALCRMLPSLRAASEPEGADPCMDTSTHPFVRQIPARSFHPDVQRQPGMARGAGRRWRSNARPAGAGADGQLPCTRRPASTGRPAGPPARRAHRCNRAETPRPRASGLRPCRVRTSTAALARSMRPAPRQPDPRLYQALTRHGRTASPARPGGRNSFSKSSGQVFHPAPSASHAGPPAAPLCAAQSRLCAARVKQQTIGLHAP